MTAENKLNYLPFTKQVRLEENRERYKFYSHQNPLSQSKQSFVKIKFSEKSCTMGPFDLTKDRFYPKYQK